jgi:hypothetical protein
MVTQSKFHAEEPQINWDSEKKKQLVATAN